MRCKIKSGFPFEMMFAIETAVQHRLQWFDIDQFFVHHRLTLYRLFFLSERVFLLEATTTAQEWTVVEHTSWVRIECPVAAFARFFVVARHFDEALVQTEIVSDGILPALLVISVVRIFVHDVLIDVAERNFAVGRRIDGHCNQCNVRIRWFYHFFVLVWTTECVWRRIRESRKLLVRIMWRRLHRGLACGVARLCRRIMTKWILIGEHCNRCGMHFCRKIFRVYVTNITLHFFRKNRFYFFLLLSLALPIFLSNVFFLAVLSTSLNYNNYSSSVFPALSTVKICAYKTIILI